MKLLLSQGEQVFFVNGLKVIIAVDKVEVAQLDEFFRNHWDQWPLESSEDQC